MPPKKAAKTKAKADSATSVEAKAKSSATKPKGKAKAKAEANSGSVEDVCIASELPADAAEPAALPAGSGLQAVRALAGEAKAPLASVTPASEKAEAAPPAASDAQEPSGAAVQPDPPRPSVQERRARLEQEVPDPWSKLSEDESYKKVCDERWDCVLEASDAASKPVGGAHVILKDAGRTSLNDPDRLWGCSAVSLDFSDNALEEVAALSSLWLRSLSLCTNPLRSLDGLAELFPKLLCLDLSFVDFPSLDGGWKALVACPRLRSLVAEGAGISTFEDLPKFVTLQSLELPENDVEDVAELERLAQRCPALIRLDLRENPVVSEAFYIKAVKKHLPRLVWHNNQSTKTSTGKEAARKEAIEVDAEVNAVDGLYKNEGCSCLHGNPCLDPTTCVDWKNREAVAAEARRKKGLRGPAGEFV